MSGLHNRLMLASRFAHSWYVEEGKRKIFKFGLILLLNFIFATTMFVTGWVAGGTSMYHHCKEKWVDAVAMQQNGEVQK